MPSVPKRRDSLQVRRGFITEVCVQSSRRRSLTISSKLCNTPHYVISSDIGGAWHDGARAIVFPLGEAVVMSLQESVTGPAGHSLLTACLPLMETDNEIYQHLATIITPLLSFFTRKCGIKVLGIFPSPYVQ